MVTFSILELIKKKKLELSNFSQVEVSARDIRSKLCKTTNYKLQETEVIYNRMLSIREEEKDMENVQVSYN